MFSKHRTNKALEVAPYAYAAMPKSCRRLSLRFLATLIVVTLIVVPAGIAAALPGDPAAPPINTIPGVNTPTTPDKPSTPTPTTPSIPKPADPYVPTTPVDNDASLNNTDASSVTDKSQELPPAELHDKQISKYSPKWELSFDFITMSMTKTLYNLLMGIVGACMDASKFFLSILGPSATDGLFKAELSSGTFSNFYAVTNAVAQKAGVPFATAFLGLSTGIAMIKQADQRRRGGGDVDPAHTLFTLILVFAVCWTLIYHALDLIALVYWASQQLTKGVEQALHLVGVASSPADIGQNMKTAIEGAMKNLTYDQSGALVVVTVMAVVTMVISAGCMFYILSVAFLRMAEIYLRASFAPVAMAFFMSSPTRQIGWGYLKRFGAVCAQAAIIILALAFAGLFFGVAATMVSGLVTGYTGIAGVIAQLLPTVMCVVSLTAIVKKSETVANSLVGLGA